MGRQGHLPGAAVRHDQRQFRARHRHLEAMHHQLQRAGNDETVSGRRTSAGGARGVARVVGRDRDLEPEVAQG